MLKAFCARVMLLVMALLAAGLPAWAQDGPNPPVAVISLVWGVVTVKHTGGDYQPATWLEPIYAQDYVKTAGPGSKLLITYFFDNHQEVMDQDSIAGVGYKGLQLQQGPKIRKDAARNPFGQGMQNPFVYTMRLNSVSFNGADEPNAMALENGYLRASVTPTYPPRFRWQALSGAKQYHVQFFDTKNQARAGAPAKKAELIATRKQFGLQTLGQTFRWQVDAAPGQTVVSRYSFMVLGKPQQKWLSSYRVGFERKRKAKQLQRSDYTDYLLMCAQLLQVDEAVKLCDEMARLNPKNPQVFRALTRAYLAHNCPAHAKQAYQTEISLGGIDPIAP
jgi:hypothetical protein